MNTLDDIALRVKRIEAQQTMTIEVLREIAHALHISEKLEEIADRMAERHGSLAPVSMDSNGR